MKRIFFYSTRTVIAPVFAQLLETLARSFVITARTRTPLPPLIRQGRAALPGQPLLAQILLPLWYIFGLLWVLMRTLFDRPDVLLLDSWPEQLFLSPFARLFRWRVVWLAMSGQTGALPHWLEGAYRFAGTGVEVVVSSQEAKATWEGRIRISAAHIVLPAGTVAVEQQSDLFKALAGHQRHRFVIGSVIANLDKDLVERLLGALSVGLSVCSSLELVIVGEGENRKQIQWLIRKLGLSSHVWLPGDAAAARWLEHVDVYIVPRANPDLTEIGDAIMAMRCGVPVLAPVGAGLGEVFTAKVGALIDMNDTETISRQFLRLQQDEALRAQLGKEARLQAETLTFDRLVADMKNVLVFSL